MKLLIVTTAVGLSVVIAICAAVLYDGAFTSVSAQNLKGQSLIEKTFPHSSKCKRCHERVYEEWETSPLAVHPFSGISACHSTLTELRRWKG